MRRAGLTLLALVLAAGPVSVALPGPVAAQGSHQRKAPPRTPAPAPPPAAPQSESAPPAEPPPAYEKDLLRLSEILGALGFLRGLCGAPDSAEWQQRMQALLDSEGAIPGRRERLAGAYNRGYRGFALTYRTCTPAALEATKRYFGEGDALTRSLAGHSGS